LQLLLISDTHGQHHKLSLPSTDILIHAGDVSSRGSKAEIIDFLDWFEKQDAQHKIFIAGNHDFFFEKATSEEVNAIIPKNVIYLNDSGITIEGINIWGSPVQPWFHNWAFNRQRGAEINKHWKLIPEKTDILITHGPAYGILDRTIGNELVGCEDLLRRVEKVQPKLFVFGHIHEAYGIRQVNGTDFVNASVLDIRYQQVNDPVEYNL